MYRWEVAQCEDAQQTGLSAGSVAYYDELPEHITSEVFGQRLYCRLILPPHYWLILLCHCERISSLYQWWYCWPHRQT